MKKGILKSLIMKKNFVPNNDRTILYKINETLKSILDQIKNASEFAEFSKYVNDIFGQKYAGAYIGLIIACVISMIFVSQIDYDKFLGHDILRETE